MEMPFLQGFFTGHPIIDPGAPIGCPSAGLQAGLSLPGVIHLAKVDQFLSQSRGIPNQRSRHVRVYPHGKLNALLPGQQSNQVEHVVDDVFKLELFKLHW